MINFFFFIIQTEYEDDEDDDDFLSFELISNFFENEVEGISEGSKGRRSRRRVAAIDKGSKLRKKIFNQMKTQKI